MTLQALKEQNLILLECISGSKVYGLDVATSDTDIRGVFKLPKDKFYGLQYIPQVSDKTNDTVYYELGRFVELLQKNNPNILELLATPEDKILYKDPIIDLLPLALFLSKRCKDTFGGYAFTQIRKARGLNKKIVNPIDKEKKRVLDFCFVLHKQGAIPITKWLSLHNYRQENCGLVNIPHAREVYGIYYDITGQVGFKGIVQKETATTVSLSSVPKGLEPIGYLSFNNQGFIKYCKDYKDYWNWVENRNAARYQQNVQHGKNYDSKNMMHTFRLLDMGIEILKTGKVIVKRPNREELLSIRRGEWKYDDLLDKAEMKMQELEVAYQNSPLKNAPDEVAIEALLVKLRKKLYD